MVKSQVKIGGRGKAGGVKFAATPGRRPDPCGQHPGAGHQGPRHPADPDHPGQRDRRGVLRLLPARPGQPHLPGDGHPRGRHGDRAARRGTPRGAGQDPGRRPDRSGRRQGRRDRRRRPSSRPRSATRSIDVLQHLWDDVHRRGRHPGRGQPAGQGRRWQGRRARRQGVPRRQRLLPPPRARRLRRQRRGEPARTARQGEAPQLRQARRVRSGSSATAPVW